jgi:GT2 family glycosyltransferase
VPADGPVTPLVSVVMVSYRTRDLVLRSLRGLAGACRSVPYEVIVVDNASGDGSAEAVADELPGVRLLRLETNVGFGRAVNAGAGYARGEWLLLLNPDTEPVGDVLGELVAYARAHPGHGVYAGRTLRADGGDDGRSVFALPSLWAYACFAVGVSTLLPGVRWANPEALPHLDRSSPVEVPAASGCVLLLRRSLFAELGGFTPDYFMYSEDVDLCLRARRAGARPVLVPGARVVHVGGAASTGVGKRVMVLRGKTTYLRLRWSPGRAAAGRALLAAGVGLRAAGARLTGRAGYWRQVWQRRAEWLAGWPPTDAGPSSAGPDQSGSSPASGTGPGTGRPANEAGV